MTFVVKASPKCRTLGKLEVEIGSFVQKYEATYLKKLNKIKTKN